MKALNGSSYVNIFSHYRPVGDPQWFQKDNPPGTPKPLIDIGDCNIDKSHCIQGTLCRERVKCSKSNIDTLSPSMENLRDGSSLLNYWKKYVHKVPPVVTPKESNVGAQKAVAQHTEF